MNLTTPPFASPDLLATLGAFMGATLALARTAFAAHRRTVDRFVVFLEGALGRQEAANESLRTSLDGLAETLQRQTGLLARLNLAGA